MSMGYGSSSFYAGSQSVCPPGIRLVRRAQGIRQVSLGEDHMDQTIVVKSLKPYS